MKATKILFFGSTADSVIVVDKLMTLKGVELIAVVTQPPRPVGRNQMSTPTPIETWAKAHTIAVLSFPSDAKKPWLYQDETQVIDTLEPIKADLIISASYGQKIPTKTLGDARYGGLNIHPSVLPRWRGGDPVPWAIMSGDHQTGTTVVSLSDKFDEGLIFAQEKIPILPTDLSEPLRTKLFTMGTDLLTELLPNYLQGKAKGKPQVGQDEPRAKRLTREIGFESWDTMMKGQTDAVESARIERKFRALHPWPGLWTKLTNLPASPAGGQSNKVTMNKNEGIRLKILKLHLDNGKLALDEVQLEGKHPVSWRQFSSAYLSSTPS